MSDTPVLQKLQTFLFEASKQIKISTDTILSKEEQIREHCVSLRIKVDAQAEILVEEIRQWNEEMRNKIDEYEKERLEKFNAEEFEANACFLKSLIVEMSDYQTKLQRRLEEAKHDEQGTTDLIEEASLKLRNLRKQDTRLKEKKFEYEILDFKVVKEKAFDPSFATFCQTSIDSIDSLLDNMVEIPYSMMPDFKEILCCFINPYSVFDELIAFAKDTDSDKVKLVKMDPTGKILKVKDINWSFRDAYVHTVKNYFIVLCISTNSNDRFMRFDYDFNEKEMSEGFDYSGINYEFAVNERFIIFAHQNQGKLLLRFANHDLSRGKDLPDQIGFSEEGTSSLEVTYMLATQKYLYVWSRFRVHIFDIECHEGRRCTPSLVLEKNILEKSIPSCIREVKLLGDKYIAAADYYRNIYLYSQDVSLNLIKQFKIDKKKNQVLYMSTDCSNKLCFFTYFKDMLNHNLI